MSLATHLNVLGSLVPEAIEILGILEVEQMHGGGVREGRTIFHYPLCPVSPQSPPVRTGPSPSSPFKSPSCTTSFPQPFFQTPWLFLFLWVVKIVLPHHWYSAPPTHYHIHPTKARSHSNKYTGLPRMQNLERKTAMDLILYCVLVTMILGMWGTPRCKK